MSALSPSAQLLHRGGFDPQLVVATVTPTGTVNDVNVAAELPLVVPGNLHLLLRLTFADGSISESSNQDFAS